MYLKDIAYEASSRNSGMCYEIILKHNQIVQDRVIYGL
jgi:hypothetical protein